MFLTLDNLDLTQKTILLRADLNVPFTEGQVTDNARILALLPSLKILLAQNARIVVISHRGRPQTKDPSLSLAPIVPLCRQIWGQPVQWVPDCIGPEVEVAIKKLAPGEIILLENLRFYKEEEANDSIFAQRLGSFADWYVNDAFSCSHRSHASIVAITHYLPALAGKSLEAELRTLQEVLETPKRPVMAIIGGSKVSSKLKILENLLSKVDIMLVGGGMANTFLAAKGYHIGQSLYEPSMLATAKSLLSQELLVPEDVVVSATVQKGAPVFVREATAVQANDYIVDLGPKTLQRVSEAISRSKTILWNGPVGIFELPPFDKGTLAIAKLLAAATLQAGALTVGGGGDTGAALRAAGVALSYTSTAGGAFLEWLEGKTLPGIAALSASSI